MGTGLGPLQRRIMAALNRHEFFYLQTITPMAATKAEYSAYQRAVKALEKRGLLTTARLSGGLVILRDDAALDAAVRWELRDMVQALSVETDTEAS